MTRNEILNTIVAMAAASEARVSFLSHYYPNPAVGRARSNRLAATAIGAVAWWKRCSAEDGHERCDKWRRARC